MSGYDYNSLSPLDFERLCCALLDKLEGRRFQRFGEGRDGGIDLQFDGGAGGLRVYQCKRYRNTSNLMSVLRKDEVGKVQRLKPGSYGIMTSASLTPENKNEIMALFRPFLKSSQFVYGPKEIDDLLDKKEYADIVRSISALWLPSFSVVSSIFNNGILGRSEHDIDMMRKECVKWAWTEVTQDGLKSLKNHHVAIFIGAPGVGKTVSAKLLLCQSCLEGYQPIITYDKIEDFESVYDPEKKQVFFYDDFLGQNYFEVISNREDAKICHFIERVRADPNKRFLLTSRTTILNRGYECSVAFRSTDFKSRAYLVDASDQSEKDRAQILYMNLYHAECSHEELRAVLCDKKYIRILQHKNFSPRIIGYILESRAHRQELGEASLFDCLLRALNNPREVWKTVYNNQLNPLERVLLWCVFLSTRLDEGVLNECFDAAKGDVQTSSSDWGRLTFEQTAKSLAGALLKRIMYPDRTAVYELLNPSIADYLISNWQSDIVSVKTALAVLRSRTATVKFLEFSRNNLSVADRRSNVIRHLAALPMPDDANPMLMLVSNRELLKQDEDDADRVLQRISALNVSKIPNGSVDDWASILSMLERGCKDVASVVANIPVAEREDLMGRCQEFESAVALYHLFSRYGGSIPANAGEILTAALATDAYEFARDLNAPELEMKDNGYMGLSDLDYERMEAEVKDYVLKKAVGSKIPRTLIDIKICLDNINLDEMFECRPDDYYGEEETAEKYDGVSDIDSLFAGLLNEPL